MRNLILGITLLLAACLTPRGHNAPRWGSIEINVLGGHPTWGIWSARPQPMVNDAAHQFLFRNRQRVTIPYLYDGIYDLRIYYQPYPYGPSWPCGRFPVTVIVTEGAVILDMYCPVQGQLARETKS